MQLVPGCWSQLEVRFPVEGEVAGYIAKYATKAIGSFCSGLDRRLGTDDLEHLDRLPAMWLSSSEPAGSWGSPRAGGAQVAGVGAHAGVPRPLVDQEPPLLDHHDGPAAGPGRHRQAPPGRDGVPLDAWDRPEDDQAVIVVASWVFVTAGRVDVGELRGAWTDPAAGRTTFKAWLEEWWGSAADLRPSTRARDEAYVTSLILPRFGGTPLAPDPPAGRASVGGRADSAGFAPATALKAYQLLAAP